jgi:cell division septum initiation protein DivIVA
MPAREVVATMARMDVSPQELRSSEIKDAWRGFNRDEVDDLLERAAVTIENLQRQVHDLESRGPVDGDHALPSNRDDAEMLQRTLLLAQRAADEEVAKAQSQARKVVDDAERRAQTLVGEAESTARRIAEGERRRLEDEIRDLQQRRELLAADADALEDYVTAYRDRIRAAVERDLELLGHDTISPTTERPELHDVAPLAADPTPEPAHAEPGSDNGYDTAAFDVERDQFDASSASTTRVAARASESEWPPRADAPSASEAVPASSASVATEPRVLEDASGASALPTPRPAPAAPAAPSSSWLKDSEPAAPEALDDGPAPWEHATAEHQPFTADTPLEATSIDDDDLDDDAFFASLREAVRDDAPLGPRDEPDTFFEEPHEERRSPFRRRR